VQFVDFGNREVISNADVRDMPNTLLTQLPSQAISCSLFGVASQSVSGWSSSDIDTFREIIEDQMLKVFFTGGAGVDGQHLVHLLKGQENVNRMFLRASSRLSNNYTSPVVHSDITNSRRGAGDSSSVIKRINVNGDCGSTLNMGAQNDTTMNQPIAKFNYQYFEPNTVLKCYAAYVTSPSKFYCQLKSTSDDLDKLMSLLNRDHSYDKGTVNMKIAGESCCARYSEDERWYRAVIEQARSRSGLVRVRFVDYGNEEDVAEESIRQMKAIYMKLPAQAIECTLDDVIAPVDMQWSSDACAKFEELFGDEVVEVKVIGRNEGSSVHRVSIDSIVNKLVSQKLAVFSKKTTQHVSAGQQRPVVEANPVLPSIPRRPFNETVLRLPKTESACVYAATLRDHKVFKTDAIVDVVVSHVVSPVEFYCQIAETSTDLDNLMEQIDNDYSKLTENDLRIEQPNVGQACCAR